MGGYVILCTISLMRVESVGHCLRNISELYMIELNSHECTKNIILKQDLYEYILIRKNMLSYRDVRVAELVDARDLKSLVI